MRKVGAVLCLFLVLAAVFVISGGVGADDVVPDDDPLALETPAGDSPLNPIPPVVSPGPEDHEENHGTDVPPSHSDDGPPGNSGNDGDDPPGQSGDNGDGPPGNSGNDGDGPPEHAGDDPPGQSGDDDPESDGDGQERDTDSGPEADETGGQEGDSDGGAGESESDPEESGDEQRPGQDDDERDDGIEDPGDDDGDDGIEIPGDDNGDDGIEIPGDDDGDDRDEPVQSPTAWNVSIAEQPQFDTSFEAFADAATIVGERVEFPVEVENDGEQEGTFEISLFVDGESVTSASVTIEAGETETVVLEHLFDEPGEYELAVGETRLGTLTVIALDDSAVTSGVHDVDDVDPAAAVNVVEATAPFDWVRQGHETTVRATVVNTANRTVTRTLTVTIDGQPVVNESVTLRPGQRDVVRIDFEAVDGNVAVEGVDAGDIAVSEWFGTGEPGPTGDSDEDGLGFAIAVLVVIASVLAAVVALDVHR